MDELKKLSDELKLMPEKQKKFILVFITAIKNAFMSGMEYAINMKDDIGESGDSDCDSQSDLPE